MPEINYKFENLNIQTFFFNKMKFMCDVPFSIYFDFETTSGQKKKKKKKKKLQI